MKYTLYICITLQKQKDMKATINVRKSSSFAQYNGLKFDVDFSKAITCNGKLIISIKGVSKEYPNNYTDFTQDELIFSNN